MSMVLILGFTALSTLFAALVAKPADALAEKSYVRSSALVDRVRHSVSVRLQVAMNRAQQAVKVVGIAVAAATSIWWIVSFLAHVL